jgi:hypothetical protein
MSHAPMNSSALPIGGGVIGSAASMLLQITPAGFLEVALYSAVGGFVGYLVKSGLDYIRKKYF